MAVPVFLAPLMLTANLLLFGGSETTQRMLLRFGRAPADIVYFGDSVIRGRSACDSDQRGIDDYLRELTSAQVALVAHPGYSVRQFAALAGLFSVTSHVPRYAVLPVNLRSFSVTWGENPGWQFGSETHYVRFLSGELSALPRFLFSKLADDPQSDLAEWRNQVIVYRGEALGRLADLAAQSAGVPLEIECDGSEARYARQLGVMYRLHYLTEPGVDHILLAELATAVERLRESGVTPIVYLTPINLGDAERLGGPVVGDAIRRNAQLVAAFARGLGVATLDIAATLPPELFGDKGCACEHLNAPGRRFVAARLAETLSALR